MSHPEEDDLYFEFCHKLTGTETDNYRHLIARAALLNELRSDAKTNSFFEAVAAETGIAAAHEIALKATGDFADLLGIDRSEIFNTKLWPPTRSKKVEKARVLVGNAAVDAITTFDNELLHRAQPAAKRMVDFVKEDLKMPWPWLSLELLNIFFGGLVGSLFSQAYKFEYSIKDEAPSIDRRFFLKGGSKAESIAQLDSFYKSIRAEIMGRGSQSRIRVPDEAKVRRNAVWFYRNQIKGESKMGLAREYHRNNHTGDDVCSGDRSTIQVGIAEAKRVLSLVPFGFKEGASPLLK
jgi:hypothetical protein